MASTNKTSHYELSQYVGSDKPTYLTDYNNDMSAIDTGMYNAQTKADSAYTLAGTADGKADTGITNAGLAQTDASTALTRIGTMTNLITTEKTNLVGAINEVEGNVEKFNFSNFTTYTTSDMTIDSGTITGGTLYVATNSDGSIAKIYGNVNINKTTSGTTKVTISSSLRPASDITIACSGVQLGGYNGALQTVIKTNGNIEIGTFSVDGGTEYINFPCVYFIKDFGDQPQE